MYLNFIVPPATTTTEPVAFSGDSNPLDTASEKEEEGKKSIEDNKLKHQTIKNKLKSCVSQPIVKDRSLKGGKKSGKFKLHKDVKDMDNCMSRCCSLKKLCDVALMEDNKCFSIQCARKSACTAVDSKDDGSNNQFAYMDHFLEKVEEEQDGDEEGTGKLALSCVILKNGKTYKIFWRSHRNIFRVCLAMFQQWA